MSAIPQQRLSTARGGVFYAFLAYGAWGLLPIYWKLFAAVPATEVLAHRMVWALPFTALFLALRRQLPGYGRLLRQPRLLAVFVTTAAILAFNWGVYIYGVTSGRIVETSLGYFINPLVSVLLGFLFLGERFNRRQSLALALATAGVSWLVWQVGQWPWIALSLAVSFGFYGLIRKKVPVPPLAGLAVETTVLAPLALGWVVFLTATGRSSLGIDTGLDVALVGAGLVTCLPLLWFAQAATRLRLSTLGLFQYLAPTMQLGIGVALYGEPFTTTHAVAFGCIWTALALFSWDAWRRRRSQTGGRPAPVPQGR